MKKIRLYICILILPFFVSCSNNELNENESLEPILLSKRIADIDHVNTSDYIDILKGNGDYKITLKSIHVDPEEFKNRPFEDHVKIFIEGTRIFIQRIATEDYYMCAYCILTDAKGVKKTFAIQNPGWDGILDFDD